jgi:hypothetical protein
MKELMQALKSARTILDKLGPVFGAADNVHAHTRTIGQLAKELLTIDNAYQFSSIAGVQFETVAAEILARSGKDPHVAVVLNNIRANGTKLDHETGLNIQEQLIRTWTLAKTVNYAEPREMVIDNLQHNIETGGGCLPGISARLVQPYALFVMAAFEEHVCIAFNGTNFRDDNVMGRAPVPAIAPGFVANDDDDEMAQAIALSKADAELAQSIALSEAEAEFAQAIALSKQSMEIEKNKRKRVTWSYDASSSSSSSSQPQVVDKDLEQAIALSKKTFAAEQVVKMELSDEDVTRIALAEKRSRNYHA